MNAENFADYLKDYSKLYQLPYEELKSLVLQYPYCSNLHYLLVEKSQLDQNKELENNIQTAAFYSPDRAALRRLLYKLKVVARQMESFELAEDYLELKDLNTIEREAESLIAEGFSHPSPEEEESISELFSSLTELPEDYPLEEEEIESFSDISSEEADGLPLDEEESEEEDQSPPPEKAGESLEEIFEQLMSETRPPSAGQDQPETDVQAVQTDTETEESDSSPPFVQDEPNKQPENTSKAASAQTESEPAIEEESEKPDDVMETTKDPVNQPQPTPKTSFTSWVQQFQPTHVKVQLSELMESKKREDDKKARKKKKKKKKKDKVILFAERSLQERQDLASETLAELLISQEQYEKATEMYKRLILKFPEKSSYFADKIKNLKNQ